jgi:anti-sigma regulatory factor (Ser/Thr protein kinase)
MGSAVTTERRTTALDADAASVGRAREWIAAVATGVVEDDRLPSLTLVMSEIVTNAVLHGDPSGTIRLAATPKSEFLCVQVTDDGAGFVPRPGAMASDAHGGFGLYLVEQLTRRWGMTREDSATRVWFEFDHRAAA